MSKEKYITEACHDLEKLQEFLNRLIRDYPEHDDPQIFRVDEPQNKGYDVVVRVWIGEEKNND